MLCSGHQVGDGVGEVVYAVEGRMADVHQFPLSHQLFCLHPVLHRLDAIFLRCLNLQALTVRETLGIAPHAPNPMRSCSCRHRHHDRILLLFFRQHFLFWVLDVVQHKLVLLSLFLLRIIHDGHYHLLFLHRGRQGRSCFNAKHILHSCEQSHHRHKHSDEFPLTIFFLLFLHFNL